MRRMAIIRNKLHAWIASFLSTRPDWDLIMMYDFDLNKFNEVVMSPQQVLGTIGRQESVNDQWDMVCANSIRHHHGKATEPVGLHDCFAFRRTVGEAQNLEACYQELGKHMFADYSLIPVTSCFGGLALYRPRRFLQCHYDPEVFDCEHVPFHECMVKRGGQGRMYMDPLLSTSYDYKIKRVCADGSNYDPDARQPMALETEMLRRQMVQRWWKQAKRGSMAQGHPADAAEASPAAAEAPADAAQHTSKERTEANSDAVMPAEGQPAVAAEAAPAAPEETATAKQMQNMSERLEASSAHAKLTEEQPAASGRGRGVAGRGRSASGRGTAHEQRAFRGEDAGRWLDHQSGCRGFKDGLHQ